ncbi:MAG: aspartate--tRNA(Asn) ligase [Candidatus Aenigmatarchaeota archaeon]
MRTHTTSEIAPTLDGRTVTVGGWVQTVRAHGGLKFVVLRDASGTVQLTAKKGDVSETVLGTIDELGREWVILVKGKVRANKQAPRGVEIIPDAIEILNDAPQQMPLDPNVPANLDTRLNWRFLDLRMPRTRAIFKVQSAILQAFREFCISVGAFELQPPIIIGSASEGGASLFAIPYFDKEAFLAQSPQLYKQMGAISLEKVFSVMPVFRAEPHDTPVHLNEVRQLDMEIAFVDDEGAMSYLERALAHILKSVKERCAAELELLGRKLEVPKLPLRRVSYTEAIEMLKKAGEIIQWGDDFTKGQEKKLVELVGDPAFFIKDWPTAVRAFYSMPYEDNPAVCRAYDLIYNGLEISSGAQRIHLPELLIKQLKAKDLDPDNFKFYIDCFRYGAPPHAGWSFGLERLTMQIVGASNIRECAMWPRDRTRITP